MIVNLTMLILMHILQISENKMNKFIKRFDEIMEGSSLDKIEKLQEEINQKQEKLEEMKLTAGMMKGFSKTANIAKTCDECGFGVPKYSGRYPKHCPNCDGNMQAEVPNDVPLDEAAKDMKGMAKLIIQKGGKNITTADFEKFGIPFELFLRMTTKPDVLVKNAKKLLGET